ncbi:adenosine deaminase 2-like [Amphiura filiformis]|uniref:adenosine deaminase 2-like n=1 Tax=Amphiura filiformis TaxID=82378 RepID=UPI003B21E5BE
MANISTICIVETVILCFLWAACVCVPLPDYLASRAKLLDMEKMQRLGGKIVLTAKEQKVNETLMAMKEKEFQAGLDAKPFSAAMHFMLAKPHIDKSEVFDIIKMMPKGAALHVHDLAAVNVSWVIEHLTNLPNLYYCNITLPTKGIHFSFSSQTPSQPLPDCSSWELVYDARKTHGYFDEWLFDNLSMLTKDPHTAYPDTYQAWHKFGSSLTPVSDLVYSTEEVFQSYMNQALLEFYQDNVQYIEIRYLPLRYAYNSSFEQILVFDQMSLFQVRNATFVTPEKEMNCDTPQIVGMELQVIYAICYVITYVIVSLLAVKNSQWNQTRYKIYSEKFINVTKEFVKQYPNFYGAKFISESIRTVDKDVIAQNIKDAISYKKSFPEYYAGHDLVAEEDTGYPLLHYIKQLLLPSQTNQSLPFFFHAGETDWEGTYVDENLFDAILLNTTRIGHGYAITKHPVAMELARKQGIAIEVNPISNQVLGLVDDLRNHPAASLIAQDFPLVISSDDPSVWNAKPLSHDFYFAFMALAGKRADLATLKQFALNSIKYSATTNAEKAKMKTIWTIKWDDFLDQVLDKYGKKCVKEEFK